MLLKGSITRSRRGFVEYEEITPPIFDYMEGSILHMDPVFHKRLEFRHLYEYRITFDTSVDEEEPRTLDIGDIRDITYPLRTTKLRGTFSGTAVRCD